MRKTILTLAVLATLTACKKNHDEAPGSEPKEKLSADIALTVKGAEKERSPLFEWSKTYNLLGFGYDAADRFNDEASVREGVVDISKYAASGDYKVNIDRSTEASWTTIQAINAVDLAEKFSNYFKETQGFRLYGNTAQNSFPGTTTTDKKYIYGYYSYYMIRGRNKFYYVPEVNSFLTDNFKKDITLLSAEALVNKYGTHVLTGIKIGAKFDVVYQAQAPEENRIPIIKEGLKYALSKTFGLMSGYLDDVNLYNLNANSSASVYYSSIGGDIEKLKTETVNSKSIVKIQDWVSSCTEDKARFIGILDSGLVPLYTFIDDAVKKAQVKSFIEQYLSGKAVKLTN